jgi:hypothetical protein
MGRREPVEPRDPLAAFEAGVLRHVASLPPAPVEVSVGLVEPFGSAPCGTCSGPAVMYVVDPRDQTQRFVCDSHLRNTLSALLEAAR